MGEQDEIVVPRPLEASFATAPRRPLPLIGVWVTGAAMGAADLVPGVSGGTVALLAGIYERLIANIRQGARVLSLLIRRRPEPALAAFKAIEWPFVVALLLGVGTSIVMLAATIDRLLEEQPMAMSAAFLGLVLGAAAVAQRELRAPRWFHAVIAVSVGVITFVGLGASPGTIEDPGVLAFVIAGAIGVSALILPGVSGAFLLLLVGMYAPVLGALRDRSVFPILLVGLGCVIGLASFSTALNYLLRRWHDLVLAAMLGLLLGSARVLWPWPDGVNSSEIGPPVGNQWLLAIAVGLTAFAIVWLLGLIVPATKGSARVRDRTPVEVVEGPDGSDDPGLLAPGQVPPSARRPPE